MLRGEKVQQKFWAKTINTACYIANRVYFSVGTKQTPYELWKGKKPKVKYFQVLRKKCYILRDREQLSKFDTRNDEGVFLGYSINSRAYRVYNLRTLTIMESINVVIDDALVHTDDALDEDCDSDSAPSRDVETKKNEKRDEALTRMNKVVDDFRINLEPSSRVKLNHPLDQVIGDVTEPMKTRR